MFNPSGSKVFFIGKKMQRRICLKGNRISLRRKGKCGVES